MRKIKILSLNTSEIPGLDSCGDQGDYFCCLIYYGATLPLKQRRKSSGFLQMADDCDGLSRKGKLSVKTETRSKVNASSQETEKNMVMETMEPVQERTHSISDKQILLAV